MTPVSSVKKGALKLALIQTKLHWENTSANLKMFERYFAKINDADLIVLPEMFSTGFSMNPAKVAELPQGLTLNWLKTWSAQLQAAIVGSLVIEENKKYYNRLVFVEPSGKVTSYNKRHLFTLAGEEKVYTKGHERVTIQYKGWKICPLVCYDLRFPVWSRNTDGYHLLLFVANWPEKRRTAWKTLLKARAIENQCVVAGLNRVGLDGNNVAHSGNSIAIGPLGETLCKTADNAEEILRVEIELELVYDVRNRFNFLNDQDLFTLNLDQH